MMLKPIFFRKILHLWREIRAIFSLIPDDVRVSLFEFFLTKMIQYTIYRRKPLSSSDLNQSQSDARDVC